MKICKKNADKTQFGGRKKLSMQHFLVRLVHRILSALDTINEHEVMQLVDWSQAFDKQCLTSAREPSIGNCVRKSLMPLLINYFQDGKIIMKWKNVLSSVKDLPGGRPQGCTLGLDSYKRQSNNNSQLISQNDKFKWVDDLAALEVINIVTIGLSIYNFKAYISFDVGIYETFLPAENLASQKYTEV